ncbi:MAG: RND transporter [Gammaproteobacteria bacterium]|nr:RND transporter [Gammaproteobacteria bacterium]MBU1654184.1 RND transporter [Gammaproteobacteria bacterium]MBU1961814.1 RND transporter [Gammaproteobacteria bacterium]
MKWIDRLSLTTLVLVALTLGLAPFLPEPHLWEKLRMLAAGSLNRPLDIFDLVMHASPWVLLVFKLMRMSSGRGATA